MAIDSFPYKILSIKIGDQDVRIAEIENPDLLFDEFLKKDSSDADFVDEKIPYWSELWPSAIALAEFISENKEIVYGKKILEIGCGLGLAGIAAAKFGGDVTLTDYLPAALDFASLNWKLNFTTDAKTHLLDWRKPKGILPVDVLLASDVAYESRAFKPLIKAMKSLIKDDGIIIISEPNRKYAKEFFDGLKKEKFNVVEAVRKISKTNIDYSISIYVCHRNN